MKTETDIPFIDVEFRISEHWATINGKDVNIEGIPIIFNNEKEALEEVIKRVTGLVESYFEYYRFEKSEDNYEKKAVKE